MQKAQYKSSLNRKHRRLWHLIFLFLLLVAGVAYLDKQGVDWQQMIAALRERFPETPPVKEVRKPISPSELPPSFDIAYADEAGKLVVAGRGEAGWTIRLGSGTQTLGETKADENRIAS